MHLWRPEVLMTTAKALKRAAARSTRRIRYRGIRSGTLPHIPGHSGEVDELVQLLGQERLD